MIFCHACHQLALIMSLTFVHATCHSYQLDVLDYIRTYFHFVYFIEISQLQDTDTDNDVDLDDNIQSLMLTESAQHVQSTVQTPIDSALPLTKAHTQPLGVVTDVQPKFDTIQSSEHHVPQLTEASEVKANAKSSKLCVLIC